MAPLVRQSNGDRRGVRRYGLQALRASSEIVQTQRLYEDMREENSLGPQSDAL